VVREGGKEVKYYLAKNKVANDFHHDSGICSATKDASIWTTAIGMVKEQGGKKVLTATKSEVDTTVQQSMRNTEHEPRSSLTPLRPAPAVPGNRDGRGRAVRGAGRVPLLHGRGVDKRPGRTGFR
jgi:hypothetical protein